MAALAFGRAPAAPVILVQGVACSRFRLRATFIDVEEPIVDSEVIAAARGLVRSRSAGPVLGHTFGGTNRCGDVEVADIFSDERSYVSDLSDRLLKLWEDSAKKRAARAAAQKGLGAILPEQQEVQKSNDTVSNMLLRAKVGGNVAIVSTHATSVITKTLHTASGETGSNGSTPPMQLQGGNEGSVGHPNLCSRPCLYFSLGMCANGVDCEYCHLPHVRRPAHLDKKAREMLHSLPKDRVKALMLPVLREKVVAIDSSEATATVFDDFVNAAMAGGGAVLANSASQVRLSRVDRMLTAALKPLGLRLLLTTFQRCALVDDSAAHDAADALFVQLRSIVAAAHPPSATAYTAMALGFPQAILGGA
mmetsp:Transcript_30807/g.89520  ORF Transcript_30807/g.89520 Transcript_30807/m.89520 type:complete len:364 (+) Transcript_30807:76-1167(+)|eukprot:CAMPEP_0170228206 /NCGR_PEP_ID=MMETSP0116_2-20130129/13821_1 /TAXON_ID=400756 /ORGANISM="Durinskia baltica, Strain CSIRO CS-38" /LENGTH=363 /DNA_ID=CAMNT_0010478945 /DNA_START=72 /DNA_END=1163 /DNA_ORIENTATION=-